MGLPGSGKTEVAKCLEKKLNGVRINTDDLYIHLYPDKKYIDGDFPPGRLEQVYNTLGALAFYLDKANPNKDYIFEGSFRYQAQREHIVNQFENKCKVKTILVEISDEKKVERRITKRHAEGAPDTYEDYLKVKEAFEKPNDTGIFVLNNSGSLEDLNQKLDLYVNNLGKK